ncbi:MAG: calcium/sodium antiporter [Myxococcales bacterium]|nr:calcium/sodium antiporter [Myxococcales bacterium]
MDVVFLLAGLALLYFGAEWLVAGAAGLARSYGLSALLVGLTVVAYGTSAPELVVGVRAAATGQGAIALGNVIGSNIANLGLILGMTALILPPMIDRTLARRELPVLVGATALLPIVLLDGEIARWEAGALVALAVGYSLWMIRSANIGSVIDASALTDAAESAGGLPHRTSRKRMALRALVGLGLLIVGGDLLVRGATGLARDAGMSDRLIGLTIVAVGTSLPELATSLVAASRGHSDIAIGNVLGSNIFNVLLIGGAAGLVGPIGAPLGTVAGDLIVLGALTLFAVAVMALRPKFGRLAATVLVLGYVAFLLSLIIA